MGIKRIAHPAGGPGNAENAQVWVTSELNQNTKIGYSFEALALMRFSTVEVRHGG